MKAQQPLFIFSFNVFFILCLTCLFASAAPSANDSVGFCCAKKLLRESTEKQCNQAKGTFYTLKEQTTAQKECRSSKPAATSIETGFCCSNGVTEKSSREQCTKTRGTYYASSTLAKKYCKPEEIFCCSNGKISERSPDECKKQKGTAYKSATIAKSKCKAADVYCCADGTVTKNSAKQCQQRKGTAYQNASDAKRNCKPKDIFCCIDTKVIKTTSRECRHKGGEEFVTELVAEKTCGRRSTGLSRTGTTRLNSVDRTSANKADLIAQQAQFLLPAKSSVPTVQVIIKNIGTATALKNTVQLTLSESKKGQKKSPLSTELSCPPLKPGQETKLIWAIKNKKNLQVDSYALHVQVDTTNSINEKNERNNELLQPITLAQFSPEQGATAPGISVPSLSLPRGVSVADQNVLAPRAGRLVTATSLSGPNWTTISGNVSNQDQTFIYGDLKHISAQRVGPPSPADNTRNITSPEIHGMSYSLSLPPSSTWLIQPVVENPLIYREIRPFTITTTAEGESITRHIVIELADRSSAYVQANEWCYFSGRVTFNGYAPTDNLIIRLTPDDSSIPASNWPLSQDGTYSFQVPPGQYRLQPHSLSETAYDNTIEAKDYVCSPSFQAEITANFDYAVPELCSLRGKVSNNGQTDDRIRSLTLRTADGSMEPLTVGLSSAGTYQLELPTGKSYTLIPNVPEHWDAPSRRAFRINPEESVKTVDFDLFQPEFRLGEITNMRVKTNPGDIAPSIKITFEAHLIGGSQEKYPQAIRVTSPTLSRMDVVSTCFFETNGSCTTTIWMEDFDVQRDSLHAQIVDLEGMPGSSKDWVLPFQHIAGDLTLHHGGIVTIDRGQNSATIQLYVKNLGPIPSRPCDLSVKINHRQAAAIPIPTLNTGESHTIRHHEATNIDPGDEIVFQINNQCDNFTTNNNYSVVIEERDVVNHPDHEIEDDTEHVRMTGESTFSWDWFDW